MSISVTKRIMKWKLSADLGSFLNLTYKPANSAARAIKVRPGVQSLETRRCKLCGFIKIKISRNEVVLFSYEKFELNLE